MPELLISSRVNWSSYIVPIAKTASKKIGTLMHLLKFISPEFLHIYINLLYGMEYCCHA